MNINVLNSMEGITGYIGRYDTNFIFRGIAKKEWALIPKVARDHSQDWREVNSKLELEFSRRAKEYLKSNSKDEEIVISQHFGLPTRLLDWTETFIVALYFACKSDNEYDGAIYCLNQNTVLDIECISDNTDNDYEPVFLYYPRYVTSRIKSQAGCFTYHTNPTKCFIDYVSEYNQLAEANYRVKIALEKIVIKKELKTEILDYLDRLGVNEYTLFGDLDSLCKHLSWRYF